LRYYKTAPKHQKQRFRRRACDLAPKRLRFDDNDAEINDREYWGGLRIRIITFARRRQVIDLRGIGGGGSPLAKQRLSDVTTA
jgi:hypothetical protein